MSANIWPNFNASLVPPSPKRIIDQAGEGLKDKTKGVVVFYTGSIMIEDDMAKLRCVLSTPQLSYHYPFMTVKYSVANPYPVSITADKMEEVVVNNEKELTASLIKIFNAPTTIDTIQKLMSLA